jgi:hypothetical protein
MAYPRRGSFFLLVTCPVCLLHAMLALEFKPLSIPSRMADPFPCGEFHKLKGEYDRSLRVWAHYMFPAGDEVRKAPEQIAQLRYEAQLDRNVAAMRLTDHQQTCSVCIWNNQNSVAKPN